MTLSIVTRRERCAELNILVDPQDEWLIDNFSWRISTKGYVETTVYIPEKRTIKLHHLIMGRPIFDLQIDHADRNKRNNRRNNLEFKTNKENTANRDYIDNAKNWKLSRSGRYEARLTVDGKYKHLGTFATQQEAEKAVESYKLQYDASIRVS